MSDDPRTPKEHGTAGQTSEVIDLGGPVARVTRFTYVASKWTRIIVMVPADPAHDIPGQSFDISLSEKELAHLVERLAWPK